MIVPIMFVGFLGLIALALGLTSLGPFGRVLRERTRRIGSLEKGPAEVEGRIEPLRDEPLVTVDGTSAVVVHTRLSYLYRSGSKVYTSGTVHDEVRAIPVRITDATGSAEVEVDGCMLLGEDRRTSGPPAEILARNPRLAQVFTPPDTATTLVVDETFVRVGAAGLVSGEAEKIGSEAVEGDYRSAHDLFRLTAGIERPLILAAFPESDVRRMLARPALMFFALASVAAGVVAALVVAAARIGD